MQDFSHADAHTRCLGEVLSVLRHRLCSYLPSGVSWLGEDVFTGSQQGECCQALLWEETVQLNGTGVN